VFIVGLDRILLISSFLAAGVPLCLGQTQTQFDQRARAVLADGAGEREPDHRREVAVALSLISSQDSSAGLLDDLAKDKDHLVREAAIVTIGELGDKARIGVAKAALDDEVPEVVFAAARTLFKLGLPEAREVLLSILEKETKAESSFIRDKLRGVVRKMRTPKSALLFSFQQGIRMAPLPGLGEGVSAMSAMLFDAEFSTRASALLLLSREQSPNVRKAVEGSLNDGEWSVRAAAIQALAQWGIPSYRRQLALFFNDDNRKVRYRAAAAYLRLESLAQNPKIRAKL
jgi:HEAT repeat protein